MFNTIKIHLIKGEYSAELWQTATIPLRRVRRWGLALSRGVSPYLLQMLTWAPLFTRSLVKDKVLWATLRRKILLLHGFTTRGSPNLRHVIVAPEAGIMQWCVSMLIGWICVCFALDQLKEGERGLRAKQACQILFRLHTHNFRDAKETHPQDWVAGELIPQI